MGSEPIVGPRTFRFRTDREADTPAGERRWKARYSYEGGWAPFDIKFNPARNTVSIFRSPGIPYGGLLCDLVETLMGVETSSAPLVRHPADALEFSCSLIGFNMSRHADTGGGIPATNGPAAYFRDTPEGAWMVLQARCPADGSSFLLAINDRRGSGEIVSVKAEDSLSVIEAFTDVFADARVSGS